MNLHSVQRLVAAAALIGAAALASGSALAQEARIGFVNTERIFRESGPARAAQQKLEAEFAKRNKDLQDAAARIKAASEKLEKDAPTVSDAERQKRQCELAEQDRDLQRRDRGYRLVLVVNTLRRSVIKVHAESPLQQSWMSDITSDETRDMNFGIFFTIGLGAGAFWGPVVGWLVESKGFNVAFIVMALSYVAGALCVLPARERASEAN